MLFKLSLIQSKRYFFRVTGCCCTFVYCTFISAITIKGTICFKSTVTIKRLLCLFLINIFVLSFDCLWHVLSITITYLTVFLLKILYNLLERGKYFSNKFENIFATLINTSKLNGGLNQMILRCNFCLALFCSWLGWVYVSFVVCPHVCSWRHTLVQKHSK